jgi:branched-chain amino acid transport system ATP-binding protein
VLQAIDLHKRYGDVVALECLNLTVQPGEVFCMLGANGAGKTTTMRAISGMLGRSGDIVFEGVNITKATPDAIVRAVVAQVPQGRGTFPELNVEDNLRAGAYVRNDDEIGADIDRWFDVFPRLKERSSQRAGSLSGGEQQMLAIARALMSRPRLLLLDEPSLGLAPLITRDLFERLGEINRSEGLTMLVVEQNASLALAIAQRGYVLETGTIVASGTADELRSDDVVRRAYLGV